MEDQVLLPPNIEDIPPPGLALVEELDKLLLVQVGGGRSWRAPLLLRIAAHRLLRSLWPLVLMPAPSRCSGSALLIAIPFASLSPCRS